MRPGDSERVRALPLFAALDDRSYAAVTGSAFLQRFPANTQLLLEGDPVDFLYVLIDGQVELSGTWNDKDTVLSILRPVSTFILAAVVLDAAALMGARVLERSDILMIPGDAIRARMAEDAAFATAVARELSGCYRGLVRTIKNQKLRSGVERLANYLLQLHDRANGAERLHLPHEKRVLASLLGMAPENLSRAFQTLKPYGVEVNGGEVRLHLIPDLRRLAKPDPLIEKPSDRRSDPLAEFEAEIAQAKRSA
jgi:CRP/FNR family transcriptional activator FtrB